MLEYSQATYIVCTTCKSKQYIGRNCFEALERIADPLSSMVRGDLTPQEREVVRGAVVDVAGALVLAVTFLRVHRGHQLMVWTEDDADSWPRDLPEAWPWEDEGFAGVPSWGSVVPLPQPDVETALRMRITELESSVIALVTQNGALLADRFKTDDRALLGLRRTLRSMAEAHGGQIVTSNLDDERELSVATPPPVGVVHEEVDPDIALLAEQVRILDN